MTRGMGADTTFASVIGSGSATAALNPANSYFFSATPDTWGKRR